MLLRIRVVVVVIVVVGVWGDQGCWFTCIEGVVDRVPISCQHLAHGTDNNNYNASF